MRRLASLIVSVSGLRRQSTSKWLETLKRAALKKSASEEPLFWGIAIIRRTAEMERDESLQPGLAAGGFSMHLFVAFSAQGDQILFLVVTGPATRFEVMT